MYIYIEYIYSLQNTVVLPTSELDIYYKDKVGKVSSFALLISNIRTALQHAYIGRCCKIW